MRSHPAKFRLLPALALLGTLAACAPVPPPMAHEAGPAFERRIIGAVNFDFDSYRIRPESFALLDNAAVALNDPQLYGLMFEVNGHTDISGRLGYNISLSMLRAAAVVDYLAARGVPRERMRPQGFGPLQPYDAYNLRSPANRRVEIVALR
jgi:outer membrane protein OmpA-like peptidoglycan-associated protein